MPRFSRLRGGLVVGADYFDRAALVDVERTRSGAPRGVVDRIDDLAHPNIDVARLHPAVVAFFEDTAGLELFMVSRWRFPFSLAWRFVRPILRRIGQFVLPRNAPSSSLRASPSVAVVTRAFALDAARDGRPGARGIVRTYEDSGDVFQAVAYSTWERAGVRAMSAAFPLPGGHIAGILRLDPLPVDVVAGPGGRRSDDAGAVPDPGAARDHGAVLTSTRRDDDAGVWIVLGPVAVRAPLDERLALWAPGMAQAPCDLDASIVDGTTIIGRHEQRMFGVLFAVHDYWFRPMKAASVGAKASSGA